MLAVRVLLWLCVALTGFGAPALAQPIATAATPAGPGPAFEGTAKSWRGIHLGVSGGHAGAHAWFRDGGTAILNPPYGAFACGPALTGNYCGIPLLLNMDGAVVSLGLGHDWQSKQLVFGLEADASAFDLGTMKTLFRPFNDRDFASSRYDWSTSATARLGYAVGQSLLYVKGGVSLVHLRTSAADIDLTGGKFGIYRGSLANSSGLEFGWVVGAGIEHALTQSLSLRGEYALTLLDPGRATSPEGDIYRHRHELTSLRLGLVWRLDGSPLQGW